VADQEPFRLFRYPRQHDVLARWAVIVALVAMSVAVLTARKQAGLRLQGRWYGLTEGRPLQGDVLYRGGLALQASRRFGKHGFGVDPEGFMQSGIEVYERLGLRRSDPNLAALYRLAVIYSKRGNPDEGLKLLTRLVQYDEARVSLYLAVSAVYDTAAEQSPHLRNAGAIIHQDDDWVSRLVLPDYYRRMGNEAEAERVEGEAARRDYVFGTLVGIIAVVYGLLALLGSALVVAYLYRRVFRASDPKPWARLTAGWSALDALEVAAVLLAAMVFMGILSGWATAQLASYGGPQWLTALVVLVSYLAFCSVAVLVMAVRSRSPLGTLLRRLGLAIPPTWVQVRLAFSGYSVMVCLVIAFAVLAHSAGVDYTVPPAQSAVEMLDQLRSIPAVVIYFLLICAVAPVLEELIFRGFIYGGLRQRFPPPLAVLLSALVFGATHVRLAAGGMVAISCVGVLLALLYERNRSLWPSIIAHSAHNALAFAIVVSMNI